MKTDLAKFEKLFTDVCKWIAIEYSVEEILKINSDNFSEYLAKYHEAFITSTKKKGFAEAAARLTYQQLKGR